MTFKNPDYNCPLCPRLAAFREDNRLHYKSFFNGPVPSFGELDAEVLIVGLAPGLKGANQTGRPFTGDYAGLILYSSLERYSFARGKYDPSKVSKLENNSDGFDLVNCRIANAVRCVPPENKPEPSEIKQCNSFLISEIKAMPNLKVILSLGGISHKAVLMAYGLKQSAYKFGHGNEHHLSLATRHLSLLNSYHCSRYNINTGVLTQSMFDDVIKKVKAII